MRNQDNVLDRIFRQHLKLAIEKSKSKPWEEIPNYKKEIEIIIRPSQAAKLIREFTRRGGASAFDYETNCLKPEGEGTEIVSCSICWRGKRTISYPWQGEAIEATDEFTKSSLPKIASNLNFENRWTIVKLGHKVRHWYWDTMLGAHVLDNRPDITSIKFQSFVHLGMPAYNKHIEPYLKTTKEGKFNRIRELDLRDELEYGGFDSYSEYWVANELMKIGHDVEMINRRGYDLLLPEKNIRIEVKSGKYSGRSAAASFGKGFQITGAKFDFCVFTTYDIDFTIKEAMVFSREELSEVANKPRSHLAAHPTTNPCLLLRYDSIDEYLQDIEESYRLEIEIDLHKYPEKYVGKWSKIQ